MANVEQTACSRRSFTKRPILIVAVVLLCHALLVTWMSFHNSANPNEPAHLAAGIYDLRYGRFEIYRVNPPLPRMIAAIPATWIFKLEADWLPSASQALGHRTEFTVGGSLFKKNDPRVVYYALAFGRLMLLPLSLFGAWICYRWASELFGSASGYLSLMLWCFSPTILTWAATVGPDLASAAFGVFGFYCFWKWCQEPVWSRAFVAGVGGGLMLPILQTILLRATGRERIGRLMAVVTLPVSSKKKR